MEILDDNDPFLVVEGIQNLDKTPEHTITNNTQGHTGTLQHETAPRPLPMTELHKRDQTLQTDNDLHRTTATTKLGQEENETPVNNTPLAI